MKLTMFMNFRLHVPIKPDPGLVFFTLVLMKAGGGVDSVQLFKDSFSQPKLDIFRGV